MTHRNKLNLKSYNGKNRIYAQHGTVRGLSKMLLWNSELGEYQMPSSGNPWIARKNVKNSFGVSERAQKTFATFESAKAWLGNGNIAPELDKLSTKSDLPKGFETFEGCSLAKKFENVVDDFRKRRYPKLCQGTRVHYDQLLRLHFVPLMKLPVREITPKVVNEWIDYLIDNVHRFPQARNRKSFVKELTLLGVILRYYDDNEDDPDFKFPIKGRHRKAVLIRTDSKVEDRDLSHEEFLLVAQAFDKLKNKNSPVLKCLFIVQYRQALRVSEAAALHWEDLKMDFRNHVESRVRICRHIEWSRATGIESELTNGFKNSKSLGGFKDQPVFTESFQALKQLHFVGAKGLVFKDEQGEFFSYRAIQAVYGQAFKLAGVEFKGTHQLRHGGCRLVYNRTGDLAVASQILGNQDAETIKIYAKRDKSALNEVARKEWELVTFTNSGEDKISSL